jgi:trehalose-phosphatase
VVLFLDYDGTLTPIVSHPRFAKLSASKRKVLRELVRCPNLRVAIVSGRSLREIKRQVRIKGLIYAGNHGLEYEGLRLRFVHPEARAARRWLKPLAARLRKVLKPFRRAFVEDKGLTLSVHYRNLPPKRVAAAKALFLEAAGPCLESRRAVTTAGKKVWEVRPGVRWNKGTLVLRLLSRLSARFSRSLLPVYLGDDQTDEDAFKVLRRRGIGVRITARKGKATQARYYLRSPREVFDFLARVGKIKRGG